MRRRGVLFFCRAPVKTEPLAPVKTPFHQSTTVSAQMQATLQEDIPDFLQKLQDVDTSEVLGVGVARVRASGPRMLAWITYGGPDGSGALDLGGGTLFSYFYSEVRTRGNNRVKVAAYLTPVHSRNVQQMFE